MKKIFPRDAYARLYSLWKSAANQLYVTMLRDQPDARSSSEATIHERNVFFFGVIALTWTAHMMNVYGSNTIGSVAPLFCATCVSW